MVQCKINKEYREVLFQGFKYLLFIVIIYIFFKVCQGDRIYKCYSRCVEKFIDDNQ